jgi:hypothetical protein
MDCPVQFAANPTDTKVRCVKGKRAATPAARSKKEGHLLEDCYRL